MIPFENQPALPKHHEAGPRAGLGSIAGPLQAPLFRIVPEISQQVAVLVVDARKAVSDELLRDVRKAVPVTLRGLRRLDNDGVNFASTVVGAVVAVLAARALSRRGRASDQRE